LRVFQYFSLKYRGDLNYGPVQQRQF
jgi:hypothetical protein